MDIRTLYASIDNEGRDFVKKNKLGEITELILYGSENKIVFSINWFNTFTISYRPQTIGLKIQCSSKLLKEPKTISKSYNLDQENLLDTIFTQYMSLIKKEN